MAATPYKRSDPTKLLRDKQRIVEDMEQRQDVPQSQRMFPNPVEKVRRAFNDAVERKRQRKNPPPVIEGGKVTGFKKPNPYA